MKFTELIKFNDSFYHASKIIRVYALGRKPDNVYISNLEFREDINSWSISNWNPQNLLEFDKIRFELCIDTIDGKADQEKYWYLDGLNLRFKEFIEELDHKL